MTFKWKQALGSVALSAMALGMIGVDVAEAKKGQKNDVIKPNPDTAAEIETGQMLDKGKPRPPSAEKGIKDQGVKPCGSCGLTGREAAPPATGDGATPAPSVDIETGQMLDKGPRWKPGSTAREAAPPATGDGAAPGTERGIKDQGVKSCNGCDKPPRARKKSKGPKVRDDSVYSTPLKVVGGLAGLAALAFAVGGGNDNPTSP